MQLGDSTHALAAAPTPPAPTPASGRGCPSWRERLWPRFGAPSLWPWLLVCVPLSLWFARPLWVARVVPLHDLPNHLARITALHHLGDPRWNLSPFYRRSIQLVPYLGHFYAVHLLTYLFRSVVRANLIFMSAYILAAPLCGLSFARATGRSPWLALFLLPLSISIYFQWGFISFCAGVMLLLPALASLYRLLDAPNARRALGVGLWCAALYLFHIVPWGGFGLYAILLCALELVERRLRGPLLATLAMLPSLGLFAIGSLQARSIGYMSAARYLAQQDTPVKLMQRAAGMIDWVQSQTLDEWVAVGLMALLLLLVVSDAPEPGEPWRRRIRIPLAFVLFIGLALATPFWIKRPFNWWMVNQRFLLPAACLASFFPRGPIRGARALLMAAAVALMTLLPAQLARQYRAFSRRAWPIIELVQLTPLGSNTLLLHRPGRSFEDPLLAPQMTVWREVYNYPLVYRGGYDPYLYDDGFPIKRIGTLPAPKVPRAAELPFSPEESHFNADTMLRDWDYFLVNDDNRDAMPADGVVKVKQSGEWILYRNILKESQPPKGHPDRE